MDDDDDSGLLDIIGDPQALNYFLHGSCCKAGDELSHTDFSASNSNSIFANTSLTDSKSSIKSVQSLGEEESSEGLQLSNNIQFFEDELESSSIPDLSEDILQKSLQEANITEQILAEEAYLDASVGSSQTFANVPSHAHSSASLTQVTNAASYSGQTLHPIGVTHVPVVPQQVGASFASNTVGVQHGFMQPVGIIPSQHIPTSSHSGSGQIHLISSINNQSPVMTINNLDGSQIILKSGQQAPPSSTSGGVLVQSHTQNGNTMFASPNVSPAGQQVTVPFNSGNFQTSLPVHNIIIHRGPAPNTLKGPINIQPKPMQVGQQMSYSVSNLGIHHHRHQGAHCVPGNSAQSPAMGQQIPVSHQRSHKASSQQPGSSIVIHSPLGEAHAHHNQFLIPAGLSINSSSLQHIQAINTQFVQTQPSHLGPHQVPAEHIMLSRNTGGMVRPNQHYPGQMLHSPGTAVQLVSSQSFSSSGGQVILNQGPSQIVGGQVAQVSPTLLHLSPGQGNKAQGVSTSSGCSNMTSNRFTVVNPSTVLQGMGPSFQSPGSGDNYVEQQNDRNHSVVNETHLPGSNAKPNSMFCSNTNSKQQFSCSQSQKKILNHHSVGSLMKNQEGQSNTTDHSAVNKHLHHHLSLSKETLIGLQNVEVEGLPGVLKRPATKQLTKEALFLQHLRKEQECSLQPDRSKFQSLDNACKRLFPYHVFQGSLPREEDLQQVDNEFETAATSLLKKTQAMLNKYRLLLLDDAMRIEPSAEMVMLDRMFNQEERAMLTREKRMALVDPDGYLAEFCCVKKFQESSSEEKVLSGHDTDAGADPSSPDPSPMDDDSKDETDMGTVHDAPFSVPKNSSASHIPNDISEDKDSLNTDSKWKNTSILPQKQLFVSLYKLKRKYTECSSDPDDSCKTSETPDPVANAPMTIPVSGSNRDAGDIEHLQGTMAGPSQDAASKPRDVAVSPGKPCKTSTPSETVKATVRNVLELKLSAKHFKSDTSSSNSAELQFVRPTAPTLEENCADKPISDVREGAAETDSVLEAAVNSILEC